jgi:chaperone required for assembly of F1-ATPase
MDVERAFAASRLEEEYQARRWGEDAHTRDRAARMRAEALAAERFLALLK